MDTRMHHHGGPERTLGKYLSDQYQKHSIKFTSSVSKSLPQLSFTLLVGGLLMMASAIVISRLAALNSSWPGDIARSIGTAGTAGIGGGGIFTAVVGGSLFLASTSRLDVKRDNKVFVPKREEETDKLK